MKVFYATQFVLPLPPGHRFPMGKYQLLRDRLADELPGIQLMQALPATDGELALAHTPGYIQGIDDGTVDPAILREIGFPWSPAMAGLHGKPISRRMAGATVPSSMPWM